MPGVGDSETLPRSRLYRVRRAPCAKKISCVYRFQSHIPIVRSATRRCLARISPVRFDHDERTFRRASIDVDKFLGMISCAKDFNFRWRFSHLAFVSLPANLARLFLQSQVFVFANNSQAHCAKCFSAHVLSKLTPPFELLLSFCLL